MSSLLEKFEAGARILEDDLVKVVEVSSMVKAWCLVVVAVLVSACAPLAQRVRTSPSVPAGHHAVFDLPRAIDTSPDDPIASRPALLSRQVIVRQPSIVTVIITSPTSSPTYDAGTASTVDLAGTGASALSVTSCTWVNSLGGSGGATPFGSGQPLPWTATVALSVGTNVITMTCVNGAQVTGEDVITVTRTQIDEVPAASCEEGAINSAIGSATDGQIVVIPAGTCEWTTPVTILSTAGVSLRGAGQGVTTITDNVITVGGITANIAAGNAVVNIGEFTMIGGVAKSDAVRGNIDVIWGSDAENAVRIHHVTLSDFGRGFSTRCQGFRCSGVIDHSVFTAPADGSSQAVACFGHSTPNNHAHLAGDAEFGTSRFIFFEDNTLNYPTINDGGLEGYGGCRYVFRFNTVHGVSQGHHGFDSGNRRETKAAEIYRNTFDQDGCQAPCASNQRGIPFRSGLGLVWDNTFSTGYDPTKLHLLNLRSSGGTHLPDTEGAYQLWGTCQTGGETFDGQDGDEASGHVCRGQVGWNFPGSTLADNTHVQTLFYSWGLRRLGSILGFSASGAANDIISGREYFNEVASFTGATGVGRGTLALRPSTCAVGTAYFATDQGSWNAPTSDGTQDAIFGAAVQGVLYKCTATNTWTLHYTPYTYPHPLVTP
ncbi:MAG TPA: hypothetical protein VI485_28745 [Vicinamibacterales bacterium]|nr:hypothetical protein [Vicinamibacterales bacterium]